MSWKKISEVGPYEKSRYIPTEELDSMPDEHLEPALRYAEDEARASSLKVTGSDISEHLTHALSEKHVDADKIKDALVDLSMEAPHLFEGSPEGQLQVNQEAIRKRGAFDGLSLRTISRILDAHESHHWSSGTIFTPDGKPPHSGTHELSDFVHGGIRINNSARERVRELRNQIWKRRKK